MHTVSTVVKLQCTCEACCQIYLCLNAINITEAIISEKLRSVKAFEILIRRGGELHLARQLEVKIGQAS